MFFNLWERTFWKRNPINQLLSKVKLRPEGFNSIETDSNLKKVEMSKSSYFMGRHGVESNVRFILLRNFRRVHLPRDLERILAALVLAWRILSCGFFFELFSDDLLFEFGLSLDLLGLADPPFPV